ncbi:MAG TPA: S-methyl-5-thioribose-1-phosphate isomerase [Clostridiaceae bacterium]|nr:S-methyl-5-thioribose-1-phosphate isomerase [Clostridiaceae bacterium]
MGENYKRYDHDLAFILRYENVAWYDHGKVRILDRRVYPHVDFVTCRTHLEVARAIADMVTQSAGPYTAASMGMALAAWESQHQKADARMDFLRRAAETLATARPTTEPRMRKIVNGSLTAAKKAIDKGVDITATLFDHALANIQRRYAVMSTVAKHLVDLFPPGAKVLTQCFGETIVGTMLREARHRGIDLQLFVPETRPYLQGARLTASVAHDMDFPVTVITDNMVAATIKNKQIDLFTSAADTICRDGSIINKVGTWQIAILCDYFDIPYYVTGVPDGNVESASDVVIEERAATEVLQCGGKRTAMDGVMAYYPAFDITPAELVTRIVTNHGIYSPDKLNDYFSSSPPTSFFD